MSNHDELIAKFLEITGSSDESVGHFYLSSCDWSLENALQTFLGNQMSDDEGSNPPSSAVPTVTTVETPGTSVGSGSEPKKSSFSKKGNSKPKFATLGDMSKSKSNGSSDEDGQAFYAGGSERSGQQVLGPPKHRKDFRDQLTDMFRMAQEHGLELEGTQQASTSSASATWGSGMRLGMTADDHAAVGTKKTSKGNDKKPIVVLKLWSQGFSINDGELRLYNDPANKEFIETVTRGEIPTELLEMGYMVTVDVEDHRHEDFKRVAVPTFRGSGHTLGSPVPNIEMSSSNTASNASVAAVVKTDADKKDNNVDNENAAKEQLKLDNTSEVTTLQIRLADGSRMTAQFNLTNTVADIQQYVRSARPQYAGSNFILVTSFPTRELKVLTETIADAKLKNAAIMQRII